MSVLSLKTSSQKKVLKLEDPLTFQIQVANGQFEKPTAIETMFF